MPNGNLLIRGSRQVQVNNENQFIRVEGLVRPEDISSNNIVLSTFMAEAKIELTGQGVVSDKQQSGLADPNFGLCLAVLIDLSPQRTQRGRAATKKH